MLRRPEAEGRGSAVGCSAVGHRRGHPAVLLVGFHQGFEGGLGFLSVESFLGLSWFPAYTTLVGGGGTRREKNSEYNRSVNDINVHLKSRPTEQTTVDYNLIMMQSGELLHYASAIMCRIPFLGGSIVIIDSRNVSVKCLAQKVS